MISKSYVIKLLEDIFLKSQMHPAALYVFLNILATGASVQDSLAQGYMTCWN